MKPPEVLDHQAALIDHLGDSRYQRYLNGFLADMDRKGILGRRVGEEEYLGSFYADTLARSLKIAQAYHVQAEMMPVLRAAAVDLEGTDYLVHERLPAEHGFLLFDEAWTTTDVWGEQIVLSGFSWRHGSAEVAGGATPGIWLTFFVDINDERDGSTRKIRSEIGEGIHSLGRWQVNHIQFMPYFRRVGPIEGMADEAYAQFAESGQTLAGSAPNDLRMIVALFRLLDQTIVDVSEVPIDRTTARRMGKKRLPARVQTIKLRRKVRPHHGDGEFKGALSHQFPVRGHWAWRACSEHHPLAEPYEKGWHARVYIAPFWKGPENAPILLTEKVWDLAQ